MTGLSPSRVVASLWAVLALAPAVGLGQVFAPPGPPDPLLGAGADPVLLPTNRKSANQIKAAHEYIAAKDWENAVKLLQRVLDESEDSLLETEGKDAQGNPTLLRSSARAEAERLLAGLPRQGLAVYQVKVGGLAQVALGKAVANPLLLDEVVRRYFLTDAGADALTRMGVAELDRGGAEEAADRFRRLLRRPDVDALPPLTLFQAALAFHAANDAERETQAVQRLGRRIGAAGLPVGAKALTLDEVRAEIARWPAAAAVSSDWPLFRGDRRRTGRADGDLPLLEARNPPTALHAPEEVAQLLNVQAVPGQPPPPAYGPALPGFVPLAVGGKLIYRGPDGLHALDAETGRESWHHVPPFCLDSILKDGQKKWQFRRWLDKYRGQPSLLDENAMLGTLSSDGRGVFFVEDLPVPPHPQDWIDMQQQGKHWFSTAEEHLYHNRLRAVDALTGALRWEVGGWQKPGAPAMKPAEYADAYFLGAPLPVGRRLFALTERHQEINLLCLDADTGALVWSQNLASTSEDLKLDAARRMQPAHLAYADGVLICPTNVGAVVAVDPLSHNILWASVYRDRNAAAPDGSIPLFAPDVYESQWRGCAPIVHGDRVVFTAPDGDSVRCVSLRDGSPVWNRPRTDDDLYVAGVFDDKAGGDKVLVVGKSSCRALQLADGQEAWPRPVPTGAPAGLGAASGRRYLLPLQNGNLFLLDVTNPGASALVEGRPDQPLGNLIFHDGDLWSQSATAVTAFPQLGKGLERAEARVAKNPHDDAARIDRGRLLYTKGEAGRAVEDWLAALDDGPPPELAAAAGERLFTVLTHLLQEDFSANEKYLAPYERLCRRPAPAGDTAEQVRAYQAEQRRRLLYLRAVTALGREGQGRVDLAFKTYLDLYESAGPADLMTAPEDPAVRIRPDLWVQGRVALLAKAASPAQQKWLQGQIDRDWGAAQASGDAAALTHFIGLYGAVAGPLGAAGREARLRLAERWLDAGDRRNALDAERLLHSLREQADSPEVAAHAQDALARLLARHGRLADALEAYRALARDFAGVVVRDGKTGAALLEELTADKRFLPHLDDPFAARPSGRVKVVELTESAAPPSPDLPVQPQDGVPPAPECRRLRLSLDAQTFALHVASADGIGESWTAPLPVPTSYLHLYLDGGGYSITYQASGHFLVISMGPVIVGVDRLERRALWVRGLPPADMPPTSQIMTGGADGSITVQLDGRGVQRLGVVGPIGPDGVYVQTKGGVAALDPSTGDVRWLRADAALLLDAFGDERRLYLVESHATGDARAVRAVRAADGVADRIPDCVDLYNHKLRVLGRCVLAMNSGPAEQVNLRFYDVQTGQDLWKKTFPAHALVLESAVPELAAVAAPDGTVTVVDLAARKELTRLAVDPKHLDKINRGLLLRDRDQFYLAFQGTDAAAGVVGDPSPNISGPVATTEVSGMIYAFDRATGALNWNSRALSQTLLLDHFEESPVLLFSALQARPAAGGATVQVVNTRSIDKRTGKVLYRKEQVTNTNNPFSAVEVDVRSGTVDLVSNGMKLRHYLEVGAGKKE